MTIVANFRLWLPELVMVALATAYIAGLTSDAVAALGALAIIVAAGVSAEELVYRYHRRQGRHGHRIT